MQASHESSDSDSGSSYTTDDYSRVMHDMATRLRTERDKHYVLSGNQSHYSLI